MESRKPEIINIVRLAIKTILLFLIFNYGFILFENIPYGKASLYNIVLDGRERLPFGENQKESFNLSLSNIDAMVASHIASKVNNYDNEFRVFIIGDSSVWGFLQQPEDTLAGIIGELIQPECKNQNIEIFNFGYPSLSVLKDLLILQEIKSLEPDLIIWLVTLESLRYDSQLETPLVANNPEKVNELLRSYELKDYDPLPTNMQFHTLIHQRRNLADILRLQFYGVMWSATGIDQNYPDSYLPAMWDLEADKSYYGIDPFTMSNEDLSIDIIKQGVHKNNKIEFIMINEPILISTGKNSDIRYNFYYPRWAYDKYRDFLHDEMDESGIEYYDFWNLVSGSDFTNSAIHLNLAGETLLAQEIVKIIESRCN